MSDWIVSLTGPIIQYCYTNILVAFVISQHILFSEGSPSPTKVHQHSNETYGTPITRDGYYSDREEARRQTRNGPDGYTSANDDPDLGLVRRHHEE